MLKLFNKTNHVLMIEFDLSIEPRGSVIIENYQYTEHVKQLQRNGFIDIEVIDNESDTQESAVVSEEAVAEPEKKSTENVSRKTSNKKKTQ